MNPTPNNANAYLRTKVMTASPAQLRLMLFDGGIKFCRQAHRALTQRDYEGLYNALTRAQKIVLELSTSLNREEDPDLCEKLASLYNYVYRRLVDANLERDETAIEECIRLLEYERETWVMLMQKLDGADGAPAAAPVTTPRDDRPNPIANIGPEGYVQPDDGASRKRFSVQG